MERTWRNTNLAGSVIDTNTCRVEIRVIKNSMVFITSYFQIHTFINSKKKILKFIVRCWREIWYQENEIFWKGLTRNSCVTVALSSYDSKYVYTCQKKTRRDGECASYTWSCILQITWKECDLKSFISLHHPRFPTVYELPFKLENEF